MSEQRDANVAGDNPQETAKPLSEAAQRALKEAEERRRNSLTTVAPVEVGGRVGPDPVRYGDWEKNGIVSDF